MELTINYTNEGKLTFEDFKKRFTDEFLYDNKINFWGRIDGKTPNKLFMETRIYKFKVLKFRTDDIYKHILSLPETDFLKVTFEYLKVCGAYCDDL